MKYKVALDIQAKKFLRNLSPHIARQIGNKIDAVADNPSSLKGEPLKGQKNLWRIRSGDYRIIYTIRHNELLILVVYIGNRKEVYRNY